MWAVAPNNLTVNQSVNGQPTLFLSDFQALMTVVEGQVTTGSGDDDYVGFAIGFDPGDSTNAAADYRLSDWKQGTQPFNFGVPSCSIGGMAPAGLEVSRVSGIPSADEFWQHNDTDDTCSPLGLRAIFSELVRRKVLRTLGAHVVLVWLLARGVAALHGAVGLPAWTVTAFLITGVVLLPLIAILAWKYNLVAPQLVRDSKDLQAANPGHKYSARRHDVIDAGMLQLRWRTGDDVIQEKRTTLRVVATLTFRLAPTLLPCQRGHTPTRHLLDRPSCGIRRRRKREIDLRSQLRGSDSGVLAPPLARPAPRE